MTVPDFHLVGNIGLDVYRVSDRDIRIVPAGSAFNIGLGAVAAGAKPSILANISDGFNRQQLNPLVRRGGKIAENSVGGDIVFLFDLLTGGKVPTAVAVPSPEISLTERAATWLVGCDRVHVGTMPAIDAKSLINVIRLRSPKAVISITVYEMYLSGGFGTVAPLLEYASIVFCNSREFGLIWSDKGLRDLLAKKIVVVTHGADGATLLVDMHPVFHVGGAKTNAVCTIGAGDILVGTFLGRFYTTGDAADALEVACAAASASTEDYGVMRALSVWGIPEARKRNNKKLEDLGAPSKMVLHDGAVHFPPLLDETIVHATACFVVRDGKLLLGRKTNANTIEAGVMYVPGGKLEPGETPDICARRELLEETGLVAGEMRRTAVFDHLHKAKGRLYRFHQYLVRCDEGDPAARDDISALQWIPIGDIEEKSVFHLTWAQVKLLRVSDVV